MARFWGPNIYVPTPSAYYSILLCCPMPIYFHCPHLSQGMTHKNRQQLQTTLAGQVKNLHFFGSHILFFAFQENCILLCIAYLYIEIRLRTQCPKGFCISFFQIFSPEVGLATQFKIHAFQRGLKSSVLPDKLDQLGSKIDTLGFDPTLFRCVAS